MAVKQLKSGEAPICLEPNSRQLIPKMVNMAAPAKEQDSVLDTKKLVKKANVNESWMDAKYVEAGNQVSIMSSNVFSIKTDLSHQRQNFNTITMNHDLSLSGRSYDSPKNTKQMKQESQLNKPKLIIGKSSALDRRLPKPKYTLNITTE